MNYSTGLAQLTGRCHDRRKLANNTYLSRRTDSSTGAIVLDIRLHATDIMTFHPNGAVTLNSGGWRTVTTKQRMNEYLEGFRINQDRGIWYVHIAGDWHNPLGLFEDGCTLYPNGTASGLSPISKVKKDLKLRARVRKFAKDYIVALRAGKVHVPGAGDCFGCQFAPTDPHQRGIMGGPTGHIASHITERYYVPSLIWRAMNELGASIAVKDTVTRLQHGFINGSHAPEWPDFVYKDAEKILARYCIRELGQAA